MYFYGWACSCSSRTHKQTPRAVRRMKFIEFVHRRKIIYSVISPSRTIQIRSSSSTNVHCSRKLFKWLSISSGCSLAPSCSKVVLRLSPEWPEGACTFVQKTMIDLIARAACDDRGRVESNLIHRCSVQRRTSRTPHLTYFCRRMVIHLNLYSQPIAFFSAASSRPFSMLCTSKCRFDFNLFSTLPFTYYRTRQSTSLSSERTQRKQKKGRTKSGQRWWIKLMRALNQ